MPEDWNSKIISDFRANAGKVGPPFEGTPLLLLHTTGAKSGNERVNPVAYRADGDALVVFASKAGGPTNPDWYHNLRANPKVTVEVGTDTRELVARVARAGFSAIWIDRFGYSDRARSLVERLGEAAGSPPFESEDGRLVLVSIVGLRRQLESTLGSEALARAREEALRVPLVPRWGEGCDDEVESGGRFAHSCDSRARLFLKNTLDVERRVTLHAGLRATEALRLGISARAFEDTVELTRQETSYERALVLLPRQRIRIDLEAIGAAEGNAGGKARFEIVDLRVTEGS